MPQNLNSVTHLFDQVKTVSDAYRFIEKSTAENFNLFTILKMETAEVKTHSRFLAELLNPHGSHAQGDKFLVLFIDYLNNLQNEFGASFLHDDIKLSGKHTKVEIERYIGRKTVTEGGRLDISLSDDHNIVVIENKIHAVEGDKQMLRYSNFASLAKRNVHVFFLTLWGYESQTAEEKLKVYPISYKKHILEWLETCKKEAVDLPVLRESITQYVNLIKKLTHQTTNKKMETDIQTLILKNAKEAALIADNYAQTLLNLSDVVISSVYSNLKDYLDNKNLLSIWEISKLERIQNEKNRGMIWLKPKILANNDWVIGLEDFNPLFRQANFAHKLFMGIRSEYGILDYAKTWNQNQSDGHWNDYTFVSNYHSQEVRLDNENLLRILADKEQVKSLSDHISNDFIAYFEQHCGRLLAFLKTKIYTSEELCNYTVKNLMSDQNISAIDLVFLLKNHFNKNDFKTVFEIRIWNEPNEHPCLVVDFSKNGISVDLVLIKDHIEFQLFQRSGNELKSLISSNNQLDGSYVFNGERYINQYPSNMLFGTIIPDIKNRLLAIDHLLEHTTA